MNPRLHSHRRDSRDGCAGARRAVDATRRLRERDFCAGRQSRLDADRDPADDLSGVSEVRAGVFVFFDLVMAGIDVVLHGRPLRSRCSTTVVGHQKDRAGADRRGVDGAIARSRHREAEARSGLRPRVRCCGAPIRWTDRADTNQEHGMVEPAAGIRASCRNCRWGRGANPTNPCLRHRSAARALHRAGPSR